VRKQIVYFMTGVVITAALFMAACEQPVGKGNNNKLPIEIPAAPEKPELIPGDGFLGVRWKKVPGAETYRVFYGASIQLDNAEEWEGELTEEAETYSTLIIGLTNMETYSVWIKASNSAGESDYSKRAAEKPKSTASEVPLFYFDYGRKIASYDDPDAAGTYTVPLGKTLILTPVTGWITSATAVYEWKVGDDIQSETGEYFSFMPGAQGEYTVHVKVTDGERVEEAVTKVSCEATEGTYKREVETGVSVGKALNCFDFMQAPGQFVGRYPVGLFSTDATTESVTAGAQSHVTDAGNGWIFSLGSFGGYLITGFDHSVDNSDGEDFSVQGNAFGTWEEPGVVWVSQDENGNGEADDTWYELKGSQTGDASTVQRYAVTWFKAGIGAASGVWKDNQGNTGTYPNGFPYLKDMDYFTLVGTKIVATLNAVGWGYVDIMGTGGFDISNAIHVDGSPADLAYIDFVKVQCGPHEMAGIFGEISTETGVPFDLHMPNPNLLIQGLDAGEGDYTYRFLNTSGYDLTILLGEQTLDLSRSNPDQTITLNAAFVYFDYYGGNVTFTRATGLVTFSM
jgi:hypothetical protein